jgi:hypothetical protein
MTSQASALVGVGALNTALRPRGVVRVEVKAAAAAMAMAEGAE